MDMKLIKLKVMIVVEPDEGSFHAYCPDLKGLHVDGATEEEALNNALEAVKLYVGSLLKHNDPIPIGVLDAEPWSFKSWLSSLASRLHRSSSYVKEVQLPVAA